MPSPTPFGPMTLRLIEVLDAFAASLRHLGEIRWADWVMESARLLRCNDYTGIEHFLSAHGGMGSINDIHLPRDEEGQVFESLGLLAWSLAKAIQRDHESG